MNKNSQLKLWLITLILAVQGCSFEEVEIDIPHHGIVLSAIETSNKLPVQVEVDEVGNCILNGIATTCPDNGIVPKAELMIAPELKEYILDSKSNCKSEILDLVLVLDDSLNVNDFKLPIDSDTEFPNIKDTYNIKYSYDNGKEYLNGMEFGEELYGEYSALLDYKHNHVIKQMSIKRSNIIDSITQRGIKIDTEAFEEYRNGNNSLRIRYDKCRIQELLEIPSLLGVEIQQFANDDSLATAMQATGVTQAMNAYPNAPYGSGAGAYISESNCPSPGYVAGYTRLNNSNPSNNEEHVRNVTSIFKAVSPNSHLYCREGCILPISTDLSYNSNSTPRIAVVSFSCSYCNQSGNQYFSNGVYSSYDKDVDDFSFNYNIPVVAAAGNSDGWCIGTYVNSLAKGLNVTTVGNYNDNQNTPSQFRIQQNSCYVDPQTNNSKPEVSAPGTSINAGFNQNNVALTFTGTSQAAPHVAGMLTNIASGWTNTAQMTASLARARLFASARDVAIFNYNGGSSSYDRSGIGGAHYSRLRAPSFYTYFEGNYYNLASNDSYPNNNVIDHLVQIGSNINTLKLYLVWLNTGTWTYQHLTSQYPMGKRFTMYLYDPNGNYIYGATSFYNGFVQIEQPLVMSGTYHVKIELSANNDTQSILRMALAGYYY